MEAFTAGLISLDDALNTLLARITPVQQQETLSLADAAGRVTAGDVISPVDVPPFDNSAMDGYALRLADLTSGAPLPVAGKAFAGSPYSGEWPAGTCIRIMTGAPVPAGCEAVVMQEQTEQIGDAIRVTAAVSDGQNIRRVGEDIRQGTRVLSGGIKLGAAELPLLASLGVAQVSVLRKLRVALFSTGMNCSRLASRWPPDKSTIPTVSRCS